MKTSEVLNRAADLLEERGWRKGDWGLDNDGEPSGALCLEGAVIAAMPMKERLFHRGGVMYSTYDECPAGLAVERYLDSKPGAGGYNWNDAEDRTASEVIEVLRACALIEAAREEQDAAWETYAELVTA